ncbi:MAG: hypothetical protein B7Z10_11130 [Rhodobacterales bacterium 32-66-7]|nr:MAG: hypothetical protein B7Z10_11130 [Rhodobacterales bacterium 32-66-7]
MPSKVDLLRLAYLGSVFAVPALLAAALWPDQGDSALWKVAAIMLGGSLFVAMKTFYYFVALRQGEIELRETRE